MVEVAVDFFTGVAALALALEVLATIVGKLMTSGGGAGMVERPLELATVGALETVTPVVNTPMKRARASALRIA